MVATVTMTTRRFGIYGVLMKQEYMCIHRQITYVHIHVNTQQILS